MCQRANAPVFLAILALGMTLALASAAAPAAEGGEPASPRSKIHENLIGKLASSDRVFIIIHLVDNPLHAIARSVKSRYWSELRANEDEIRQINRKYVTGARPKTREEAARIASAERQAMSPGDRARVREINERSRTLKENMRRETMRLARESVTPHLNEVASAVEAVGGMVTHKLVSANAVSAIVPGNTIETLAAHPLVDRITEDQTSRINLSVSVPSIYADTFWNASVAGGGSWYGAVCDSGVDTSHPALSSKTWWEHVDHGAARWVSIYADDPNSTDDLQGHGTHVAGIMGSDNLTDRGVSYGATRMTNLKAAYLGSDGSGYIQAADRYDVIDWGLENASFDVLNNSNGSGTPATADDDDQARFFDALVADTEVLVVKSAGNLNTTGAPSLDTPAIHYNGLVVANMNDRGTSVPPPEGRPGRTDDIINTSSSLGPTPGGRKKPDITAPGTNIMSCNNAYEGGGPNDDFVQNSGTSMAAPHVAGAALLLYECGVHDPRAVKAVLINSADDWGTSEWDATYGWGYINLDTAYLSRADWFIDGIREEGTTGDVDDCNLYYVPSPASGDKVTMCWDRWATYRGSRPPNDVWFPNDLNMKLYSQSDGTVIDSSTSSIDNVEQVQMATTLPVVVKVYSTGSFPLGYPDYYAIAGPSGFARAEGPEVEGDAEQRTYTPALNSAFPVRVRLKNTGDVAAQSAVHLISLPLGVTYVSGDLAHSYGAVAAGSYSDWVEIWLKATTTGRKMVTIEAQHDSYGVTESNSDGYFFINPGASDTQDPETIAVITNNSVLTGDKDFIDNGGFEDDYTGWATSMSGTAISTTVYRSGSKSLRLGFLGAEGYAQQTISLPVADSVHLEFWSQVTRSASLGANAGVEIYDNTGNLEFTPWTSNTTTSDFEKTLIDLSVYEGDTIKIKFYTTAPMSGTPTGVNIDDVRLIVNGTLYADSTTQYTFSARDDGGSGLDYTESRWDLGGWSTAATVSAPYGDGSHNLQYRSYDYATNTKKVDYDIIVDQSDPVSVLLIDPGTVKGRTEQLSNGDFEGGIASWTTSGFASISDSEFYRGEKALRIGAPFGGGSAYQDVSIPVGTLPTLSFWYKASRTSSSSSCGLQIRDTSDNVLVDVLNCTTDTEWGKLVADVSAFRNKTIRLYFYSEGSFSPTISMPPTLYVDDVSLITDGVTYTAATNTETVQSYDSRSGVGEKEYKIDGISWTTGESFSVGSSGSHTVEYRSTDNLSNSESTNNYCEIVIDSTAPTGSIVINNGAGIATHLPLVLTLSATDNVEVSQMRIQSDTGVWGDWEPYRTSVAYSLSGTSEGVKQICVEFMDGVGNTSPVYCDTIQYRVATLFTIPQAKTQPAGAAVRLLGKVITGIFPASGYYYIQEPGRAAGIRVRSNYLPASSNWGVDVEGITQIVGGELEVAETFVAFLGAVDPIGALGMRNINVGGGAFGSQPAVPAGATGASNVGLLVTVWGEVKRHTAGTFFINDGSIPGVGLEIGSTNVPAPFPTIGSFVTVTGVSGAQMPAGVRVPIVRPRSATDIR